MTTAAVRDDALEGATAYARVWSPLVVLRWLARHRRFTAVLLLGVAALLVAAAHADADPGTELRGGPGDVLIGWMGIKDTDGVPVAKYVLTLNYGGWNDPLSAAFASIASLAYEGYLVITTSALWLIKFGLDFGWMDIFAKPFGAIGHGVEAAASKMGVAPTALGILAFIIVFTALSGKIAKAFSNIVMALLMMGVAATVFAHPLQELIGSNGLLAKGRDTGLEIADTLSPGMVAKAGRKANTDRLTSNLADRFLREPTQMINFGQVSDSVSDSCKKAWSKGVKNGHGDKLKDDIKGCDKDEGKAMHQNSMGSPAAALIPIFICQILAWFLIAFAVYFIWHVVKAAVQAMMYAAIAPVAFMIGVVPGGAQTFAWKTVLDCLMAYVAMIIYAGAFGGYTAIIDQAFTESKNNPIKALFLTALVLGFAFAFMGPLHRMFNRNRDAIAARISGAGNSAGAQGRGHIVPVINPLRRPGRGGDKKDGEDDQNPAKRIDSETDSASTTTAPGAAPGATAAGTVSGTAGQSGTAFAPMNTPDSGSMFALSGNSWKAPKLDAAAVKKLDSGGDRLAPAIRLNQQGGQAAASGMRQLLARHSLSEAA